ncbi:MAG: hypothetical protein LQ340_001322 [Diploschistes diacapsis]|nr:MAG: hypothetical protein LQ340_001322 [Diploschistes diacapsis]
MTEEIAAKRLKASPVVIGTHNGHFHADEALAVYLLRLLPSYNDASLVRTRDPNKLAACHTVVDVGGEYDAAKNRYDHHQRTFDTTFPSHGTKLSSAGLIYMHFGRAIIAQRSGLPESHPDVSLLFEKLYTDFVEAFDANDNGIELYDRQSIGDTKKRFKDFGVTLASLVSDLNQPVDDPLLPPLIPATSLDISSPQAAEDSRFLQASALVGTSFLRKLALAHGTWLPARATVLEAYNARLDTDPSGQIITLPRGGVPWKEHLYNIEASSPDRPQILYVLYPESEEKDARWRVQAVSVGEGSFESRRPLREEWRGVRDAELSEKAGIEGCVFCHASGFTGGNVTRDGVLEMARRSLVE